MTLTKIRKSPSFLLRLSPAMMQQAKAAAKAEGLSLNQFISLAVAERVSRLIHAAWLKQLARMRGQEVTPVSPRPAPVRLLSVKRP